MQRKRRGLPGVFPCGETKIPTKMRATAMRAGMRKAGPTLPIIFTPPKTIRQRITATITPYTCISWRFVVSTTLRDESARIWLAFPDFQGPAGYNEIKLSRKGKKERNKDWWYFITSK